MEGNMKKIKVTMIIFTTVFLLIAAPAMAAVKYEVDIEDVPGQITFIGDALKLWDSNIKNVADTIMTSPWEWSRGTEVVKVMDSIYQLLMPIGLQLVVIFFFVGSFSAYSSFIEMKRPEVLFKTFVRFAISVYVVKEAKTIMQWLWDIVALILDKCKITMKETNIVIPKSICQCVDDLGFLESGVAWVLALICNIAVIASIAFLLITVYLRFFKIYMYTAAAPLAASAAAGRSTQQHATGFLKSYVGVMLEGFIIVLACMIFSAFTSTTIPFLTGGSYVGLGGFALFIGEKVMFCLVLVTIVRASDRIAKEMFGLYVGG